MSPPFSQPTEGAEVSLATIQDVIEGASKVNAVPLWPQMVKYNPPAPNPTCIPHIWRYDEVRPYLVRAGELVKEKDAERRVLMLVNPKRGLQLVMPHETAPAHRHTAFALRFVIEGNGGFTAVHGKRIPMNRGDVILTPTWNWHDHGKDGSGPMIWLDGLDLPCFRHFPVHFVEHYQEPRYPADDVTNDSRAETGIVFPWEAMRKQLDGMEGDWSCKEYRKADGNYGTFNRSSIHTRPFTDTPLVSKTLGPSAERINRGKSSQSRRETASSVYHVIEGCGYSNINEEKFEWKQGDTFCIPSWYRYQHFAGPDRTVYLYRFDDKPMIEALGFYRREEIDMEAIRS